MDFTEFRDLVLSRFNEIVSESKVLYRTDVDIELFYDTYLDSFPEGKNEVFRKSREFDCSCCRHFLQRVGILVGIDEEYNRMSLWDFDTNDDTYQPVIEALRKMVHESVIISPFITTETQIGVKDNVEMIGETAHTWSHFYAPIPTNKVVNTQCPIYVKDGASIGKYVSDYVSSFDLLTRGMEETTAETIEDITELISEGGLARAEQYTDSFHTFSGYFDAYHSFDDDMKKNAFLWRTACTGNQSAVRIRNNAFGTMLKEMSKDGDIETAVFKYEKYVAGDTYQRPNPIFTTRQKEAAKKRAEEGGYIDSLSRRFATKHDIPVDHMLFVDRSIDTSTSPFDELATTDKVSKDYLKNAEDIGFNEFMTDVFPKASKLELLFKPSLTKNLASLIAPGIAGSKSLFKWDNGLSWTYNGDIAARTMKDKIAEAGGKVSGDFRFSIEWNYEDSTHNPDDLDAHVTEVNGGRSSEIFYGNKGLFSPNGGKLDVDIQNPAIGKSAVENIIYPDKSRMSNGTYNCYIVNYTNRGGMTGDAKCGVKAEIEINGEIHEFEYRGFIPTDHGISVAVVHCDNGELTIDPKLPYTTSSVKVWGLDTNTFVPVTMMFNSPNYWEEEPTGMKHLFMIPKGCKNPGSPRGFFNEFLKGEFRDDRKVFEALSDKMRVNPSDEQVSGFGFAESYHETITMRVDGKLYNVTM